MTGPIPLTESTMSKSSLRTGSWSISSLIYLSTAFKSAFIASIELWQRDVSEFSVFLSINPFASDSGVLKL
jgi:hypothetical protein